MNIFRNFLLLVILFCNVVISYAQEKWIINCGNSGLWSQYATDYEFQIGVNYLPRENVRLSFYQGITRFNGAPSARDSASVHTNTGTFSQFAIDLNYQVDILTFNLGMHVGLSKNWSSGEYVFEGIMYDDLKIKYSETVFAPFFGVHHEYIFNIKSFGIGVESGLNFLIHQPEVNLPRRSLAGYGNGKYDTRLFIKLKLYYTLKSSGSETVAK